MDQVNPFVLKRLMTSVLLVGALLGGTACASGGGSGSSSSGSSTSGREEITREDIDSNARYTNAMEIIRAIRPFWLSVARGAPNTFGGGGQPSEPVVFRDGVRFGGLSSLLGVNLNDVERMRHLNSSDATTLYGTGYFGGAIQIFTRGR